MTEVEFLGMIVGCGCIHMDPAKLSAIATWPLLKTFKAIWSFLGFCNFYRWFILGFSNTVAPLTALTHKNHPWMWGPDQQTTFTTLLSCFQTTPVLCLLEVCKPFTIMTDASLLASGGVLMQKDDNGDLHPCAYLSQMFTPAERNYDIYDRELLAVIHALDHWHHYLQGTPHPVTLLTNHKNLTCFRQPQKLSRRQAHWMMFLQDFDLHFIHIPGSAMGPADALSHLTDPDLSSDNTNVTLLPDDLFICTIDTILVDKITSSTVSDPLVLDALKAFLLARLCFPTPLLLIGTFPILVFTLKTISTFLLMLTVTLLLLFTRPSPLAMEDSFAPTPSCPGTTGGQVCPPSSTALSPAVPFANR